MLNLEEIRLKIWMYPELESKFRQMSIASTNDFSFHLPKVESKCLFSPLLTTKEIKQISTDPQQFLLLSFKMNQSVCSSSLLIMIYGPFV